MTLKEGYDVAGARALITPAIYALNYDEQVDGKDVPLIEDGRIITGNPGKFSLYSGPLAIFAIGDLLKEEQGLRGMPSWGYHEGWLWVVAPGESETAHDTVDEITRIIFNYIKNNPSFATGVEVYITQEGDKPVQRLSVSFDKQTVEPENKKWNVSVLIKLIIKIAFMPPIVETPTP